MKWLLSLFITIFVFFQVISTSNSYAADIKRASISSIRSTEDGQLKIIWNKIDNCSMYELYRATEYSGSYKLITKTTTATSYIDKKALEGNAYFYKVRGINSKTKGMFSAIKYGYVESELVPKLISEKKILSEKESVVVVSVKDNTTNYANISYYKIREGKFNLEFSTLGYVGKNGISKQKEGDKKTPTGKYGFSMAFGTKSMPTNTIIPYAKVDSRHWVVSDPSSKYYNIFVSTKDKSIKRDWKDSYGEQLYKYDKEYSYSLFIDYNKDGVKGKGSAIFLHCFSTKEYTAGCVAISEVKMKYIITSLNLKQKDIDADIIIDTYNNIKDSWD